MYTDGLDDPDYYIVEPETPMYRSTVSFMGPFHASYTFQYGLQNEL